MAKVEKKTLFKGNMKRDFSIAAAKIAVGQLGWTEVSIPIRPIEIGRKTSPPEITKPIKLIEPPVIKAVEPVKVVSEITEVKVSEIQNVTASKPKQTRKKRAK